MSITVPVIDLAGTPDDIAVAIGDACRSTGFFQVVNHSVTPARRDGMLALLDEFFELPDPSKLAYRPSAAHINRGYAPSRSESLSYSIGRPGAPDLFEAFNVGVEDWPAGDPYYEAEAEGAFAPNLWPHELPDMRPTVLSYMRDVGALAHRLIGHMEDALGLERGHLNDRTTRSVDVMRLIRYQRDPHEPLPTEGQMRMGAHTDYGIVTILLADPVPGLQIIGPDDEWHDVTPVHGGFLINLGDALAVWTNDLWRSTLHRVVPPRADGPARRRSVAFFRDGDLDARIECLPTCTGPERPPRYPPVTIKEHLDAKLLGPRLRTSVDTVQTARGPSH